VWTPSIPEFVKDGDNSSAMELFVEMRQDCVRIDGAFVLSTVIGGAADLLAIPLHRQMHGVAIRLGFLSTMIVGNALADKYAKCSDIQSDWKAFQVIPVRGITFGHPILIQVFQGKQPLQDPKFGLDVIKKMEAFAAGGQPFDFADGVASTSLYVQLICEVTLPAVSISRTNPWKDVFDSASWAYLIVLYIIPKLRMALQEFESNPANQKLDQFNLVILWASAIPVHHMVHMLEIDFFSKCQLVLYHWLCSPNPDFNEIMNWYKGWKGLFPPELLTNECIRILLTAGLDMMNKTADGLKVVQHGTIMKGSAISPAINLSRAFATKTVAGILSEQFSLLDAVPLS
jgi:hypothetical protein